MNFELDTLCIPAYGTNFILNCVEEVNQNLSFTIATNLATFSGKILSTKLVLGNLAQLKARNLSKTIDQQSSQDSRWKMSSCSASLEKLFFWKSNFEK